MFDRRKRLLLVVSVAVAAATCGNVTRGVRVATHTTLTLPDAAPSPELIEKHCPFGMPEKLPSLEHGPTQLIGREIRSRARRGVEDRPVGLRLARPGIGVWRCRAKEQLETRS